MSSAALSLEQAPPIWVPFRFFLTAPLFAFLAGLLLLVEGPDLLISRWGPTTLVATHLLTLGFLGLVMCGAMMQMLPVVAGSPVPAVVPVSLWVYGFVGLGATVLCGGFLTGSAPLFELAGIALGLGFAVFVAALTIALLRVGSVTPTVIGMRLALAALVITLALGIMLIWNMGWSLGLTHPLLVTDIHLGWGLLGWVGWLVAGVAYQVVPMFQLTPEYPRWLTRFLVPALFVAMLVWTLLMVVNAGGALDGVWTQVWQLVLALGYGLFASVTLWLQQRRKRRLSDSTLLFWRIGMFALLVDLAFWVAGGVAPGLGRSPEYPLFLGVILLLGVALSVVFGMLYKIVPFLCWFHLQHRKVTDHPGSGVRVPNMKAFIPDSLARRHLLVHLLSLGLVGAAVWVPQWFARPAGLVFALSAILLWSNLWRAVLRYRRVSHILDFETESGLQSFSGSVVK